MSQLKRVRNRRRAFTLLEVLMVVVIIGILAAFIVPQFVGVQEGAEIKMAEAAVKTGLSNALELYKFAMGVYPEELTQLIEEPDDEEEAKKWKGPYLEEDNLVDPWGNEWYYRGPEEADENTGKYDFGSNGPNGEWGDDDDIKNWKD